MSEIHSEAIMSSFWDHYQAGHLTESKAQLEEFGYNPEVVDFVFNPSNYYFPNIQHNRINKPASVDESAIPVVALQPGIEYDYYPNTLHPFQKIALSGLGFRQLDLQDVHKSLTESKATITTSNNGEGSGSVYSRHARHKKAGFSTIQSSPTLVFNVGPGTIDPEEYTSVAVHEPVHIVQALEKPLRNIGNLKEAMQNELEAYAVQAKLVSNNYVKYTLGTAMAGSVDIFRQRNLGTDEFTPTNEFMRAAAQDDVVSKVVRSLV